MELNFNKTDKDSILQLREEYLHSLPEGQEYFLEIVIEYSDIYEIILEEETVGYLSYDSDERKLFELYIVSHIRDKYEKIFKLIIDEFNLKSALCKTFDHPLLAACMQEQKSVSVAGILFREKMVKKIPEHNELVIRKAAITDLEKISLINEYVFESVEEIRDYILSEQILLFEKESEIVGIGLYTKIFENRLETDIGMLVNEKFRREGFGVFIINYMYNYLKESGLNPQCGCSADNIASKKTLEKAGFISKYSLLNFEF